MARMHARKRGKSGSTKPVTFKTPSWTFTDEKRIREIAVDLLKRGEDPSKIGIILRDQYAVPSVKMVTGKKLTTILKEEGVIKDNDVPEDMKNLMKRALRIARHLEKNPKDLHNLRGLQLVEAKIRRLVRYYKRRGVLPDNWKYSLNAAKLLVE